MRHGARCVALFALALCGPYAAAQVKDDGVVEHVVSIAGAEQLLPTVQGGILTFPQPGTYRAYIEPRALHVQIGLHHDSSDVLLFDQDRVRKTTVHITSGDVTDVPVVSRWLTGVLLPAEWGLVSVCKEGPVETESAAIATWTMALEHDDGMAFANGEYRIRVTIPRAESFVFKPRGGPWKGRSPQPSSGAWELRLSVRPPTSRADWISMYRWKARDGFSRYAWLEVLDTYSEWLKFDPTDSEAALGRAGILMMLRRFREAIPLYQKAIPVVESTMTSHRQMLARAYVGVGDEAGAVRVLRLGGVSEAKLAAALQDSRDFASRRNGWAARKPLVLGGCDA